MDNIKANLEKLFNSIDLNKLLKDKLLEEYKYLECMSYFPNPPEAVDINHDKEKIAILQETLTMITKRDDWTSGECRHHARKGLDEAWAVGAPTLTAEEIVLNNKLMTLLAKVEKEGDRGLTKDEFENPDKYL